MNLEHIQNDLLDQIDMSQIQEDAYLDVDNYISQKSGENHYRLLAHISTLYRGAKLLDIGTFRGWSALSLSYNPDNKVISYDICQSFVKSPNQLKDNIEYRIGNFLNYPDEIKESPFIFLDVDPHDGIQERQIFDQLEDIGYKGIVMLDDIHHFSGMNSFFNNIKQRKADMTKYGHCTGTGIVYFE